MGNNLGMDQLGQYGSAYTDVAQHILPPVGMVIVAIQFLEAANTPTVLTPEKLDAYGPGFPEITGATTEHDTADNTFNFNGIYASDVTDATYEAGAAVTIAAASTKIQVGQYVMLVNNNAEQDGTTVYTYDTSATQGTPFPIYSGPNATGVTVTAYGGSTDDLYLSHKIIASSQTLVFLDPQHGMGGIRADGEAYPANSIIYGRWTVVKPSAAGCICYFGY